MLATSLRYEKEHGLPFQYLNVAITAQGHGGAFQVSIFNPIVAVDLHDKIRTANRLVRLVHNTEV